MAYSERVTPHPGYFLALIMIVPIVAMILAPRNVTLGLVVAPLVYVVLFAISVVSSPRLEVGGGVFRAGRARIPVSFLGEPEIVQATEAQAERGTKLDARAYLCIRGGSMPMVKIANTDPADPCPYWLVSTRRPQELVAALGDERAKLGLSVG